MNYSDKAESAGCSMIRNTTVLSAKELFQWRKKENPSVPQRGGTKDFEPDGSWLQAKRLEAFHEEHCSVLAEPRVEKSGNLVKGVWNAEMRLVNIEKTAKFWMKMGFVDQQRNWLHPEEALFLMEVNCLELMHQGLARSLQEAYSILLHPSSGLSEEEYQVYAHLRRLGFIVIRHVGKLELTAYERKIGLDKHAKKKNRKRSKKTESSQNTDSSAGSQVRPNVDAESAARRHEGEDREEPILWKQTDLENDSCSRGEGLQAAAPGSEGSNCRRRDTEDSCPSYTEPGNSPALLSKSENGTKDSWKAGPLTVLQNCGEGEEKKPQAHSVSSEPPLKKIRVDEGNGEKASAMPSNQCDPPTLDPWSEATRRSLAQESRASLSAWDFDVIQFPDIGGRETVQLSIPPAHLLPPNTGVDEEYEDVCMFDVEDYRRQQWLQPQSVLDQDEGYGHLKHLEFSYAEWHRSHFRPVAAKNWREWKAELRQLENSFIMESPVAHLWQGEVTPLVQPKDATSTASLLEKLSVIQPFTGPFPAEQNKEGVKITFDVYLPNTTFRKSSPGVPDHRVCVTRGEHPPDLFEVHAATVHLGDDVPLHWAVINCGED